MKWRSAPLGVWVLALAAAPLAGSFGSTGELQAALAKPLSPGSVAMLVEYRDEAAARGRWAEALRDPHADIRAAAARVVNVAGAASLVPDLARALASEQDRGASVEEFRALAALGDTQSDETLLGAAKRIRGPLIRLLAESLGRRGPEGAKGALARMGVLALREQDEQLWGAVLDVARESGAQVDAGLIVASVGIRAGAFRAATCWYLARTHQEGVALPPQLTEALEAAQHAVQGSGDPQADFACEVLGRVLGHQPAENARLVESVRQTTGLDNILDPAILKQLTGAEKVALGLLTSGGLEEFLLEKTTGPSESNGLGGKQQPGTWQLDLSSFPSDFVSDLLATTGCRPSADVVWSGAQIVYGPYGRPRTVALIPLGSLGKCDVAARILLATALAPSGMTPTTGLVLLRLDRTSG